MRVGVEEAFGEDLAVVRLDELAGGFGAFGTLRGIGDRAATHLFHHEQSAGRPGARIQPSLLRIEVDGDGRVTIHERESGTSMPDVVRLTRARDAGDLYTPAIRESLPVGASRF